MAYTIEQLSADDRWDDDVEVFGYMQNGKAHQSLECSALHRDQPFEEVDLCHIALMNVHMDCSMPFISIANSLESSSRY